MRDDALRIDTVGICARTRRFRRLRLLRDAAIVPRVLTTADIASLTQGSHGLALAYATVGAPLVAGLLRGHATLRKVLLAPLAAVPVTAAAGAVSALSISLGAAVGLETHGLLQLGINAALSMAMGYGAGRLIATAPRSSGCVQQRGTLIAEHTAGNVRERNGSGAGLEAALRPARSVHPGQPAIAIAGVPISREDESKHFKLLGTTGTDKSTAIRGLLSAALARGDRAVIADPDGGYLEHFYDPRRGDLILNPFERGSVKWDLFAEIREPYDVEQLARSLIPDHEGSDRSWRGYARTFFTAITRQAHAAGVRDAAELYRLLVIAKTDELRLLVAGTPAQPFLEEHNMRMFDSIRSVASSAVGALEHVARQRSTAFSVREWVRPSSPGAEAPRGVLFIPYQAGQIAALRSPISAWMRLAIFEAMNGPPEADQRLWFVIDELDALGQVDGLKDALVRLRKFGGRCVLGLQSVAQVSGTYGADAHTIIENCGNTLVLRCSASEGGGTSRFASQLIGEREVLRTTRAWSHRPTEWLSATTRSEHFVTEAALLPSQIEQLPDLVGLLKIASRPHWLHVRLTPEGEIATRADPSDSVTGRRAAHLTIWNRWRATQQPRAAMTTKAPARREALSATQSTAHDGMHS